MKNFYGVIIGSELLNGRRLDQHFKFLNQELLARGWDQIASFTIKDDVDLISKVFSLIKNDEKSVLFSFGGIGATPDDLTRQIAANIFSDGNLYPNNEAKNLIINQFKDEAFPHRINMANLPKTSKLLKNIINQVPGFSIDDRFFFTPGFPSMAHPMVIEALDTYIGKNESKIFYKNFIVNSSESNLISIMNALPASLNLSSLPKISSNKVRSVEIQISSKEKDFLQKWYDFFINSLKEKNIEFTLQTKDNNEY